MADTTVIEDIAEKLENDKQIYQLDEQVESEEVPQYVEEQITKRKETP